jgi:hypothetical protein
VRASREAAVVEPAGDRAAGIAAQIPDEAVRLVGAAASSGLTIRVTGSVAVHLRCGRHRSLMPALGRRPFYDIDFWGRDKEHQRLEEFFGGQGYLLDPAARGLREWGIKRQIYAHPETGIKVDVFLDKLVMAHTIGFAGQLATAGPCISLADLVLSKLQIHEITSNDLIDLTVLFGEHPVGEHGAGETGAGETGPGGEDALIDLARLRTLLCDDWGFWYTATGNLGRLAETANSAPLPEDVRQRVLATTAQLRDHLAESPKSRRWRLRAKVGTRKRWYETVEEVAHDGHSPQEARHDGLPAQHRRAGNRPG